MHAQWLLLKSMFASTTAWVSEKTGYNQKAWLLLCSDGWQITLVLISVAFGSGAASYCF